MKFLGLFVFLILAVASSTQDNVENGKELSRIDEAGAVGQGRGLNSQRRIRGGILLNLLCRDDAAVKSCPFLKAICRESASNRGDSGIGGGAGAGKGLG